ncbi:SDR family NAD(P)-dependent oxidoreductase [Streptomyces sp. NPDC090741]|uniref:SDR family NAD(P)-dependent oxidoreductase n=1 Tax=Streptomyces sp. NPDC090741 TaxID=3365967 RepID=UPI003827F1FD
MKMTEQVPGQLGGGGGGSDLVLVARRRERLEEPAAELSAHHRVQVHVPAMDLAIAGPGQALARQLDQLGLQATSVINNAGFAGFGPFHQADPVRLRQEIAVDVTAVADISRAFIEQRTEFFDVVGTDRAAGGSVL